MNDGSQGGREAIAFLRSLGDMLDQGAEDTRVTVKWDGAPAVICGIDPQKGDFFVGTKSVFNKVSPKICYSEQDVDKIYPPCLLYTSPSPRDATLSRMPSSA